MSKPFLVLLESWIDLEDFVELESLAPFVQLAPGESVNHIERWEVSASLPAELKDFIDKI